MEKTGTDASVTRSGTTGSPVLDWSTIKWDCFYDSAGNGTMCRPAMIVEPSNNSTGELLHMTARDASWILTSAVIIFTMQTGFGLLESGCVSHKSEINIMVKNALDVVFGGFTYWAVGFGLSFGSDSGTNSFIGVGNFFLECPEEERGYIYALFLFQLSFATTATTIVSGAMTERTKLLAYNIFSLVNTFIYCIPAHWVWAENGFLYQLGVIDVAGCGPVHLIGGVTGLIATLMLGPRRSAAELLKRNYKPPTQGPVKCILGMFMLWWGWLRFNSGSVFIVSTSSQWQYAVTAAVNTILASIGGGVTSVTASLLINRVLKRQSKYDVGTMVSGVLGSLVSITSVCTLCLPWEAFAIGAIAPAFTSTAEILLMKLNIDDPVGVVPVHLVCSVWGLLTVGLFVPEHETLIRGTGGLVKTGKPYLLGVQALAVVVIATWSAIMSYLSLKLIDLTIGLRLSTEEEDQGVDFVEHGHHKNLLDLDVPHIEIIKHRPDTTKGDVNPTGSDKPSNVEEKPMENDGKTPDSDQKAKDLMQKFLELCDSLDMQVNISNRKSHSITIEMASKHSHSSEHTSNSSSEDIGSNTGQSYDHEPITLGLCHSHTKNSRDSLACVNTVSQSYGINNEMNLIHGSTGKHICDESNRNTEPPKTELQKSNGILQKPSRGTGRSSSHVAGISKEGSQLIHRVSVNSQETKVTKNSNSVQPKSSGTDNKGFVP